MTTATPGTYGVPVFDLTDKRQHLGRRYTDAERGELLTDAHKQLSTAAHRLGMAWRRMALREEDKGVSIRQIEDDLRAALGALDAAA